MIGRLPRPRLLPLALAAMAGLAVAKLERLASDLPGFTPRMALVAAAQAGGPEPTPAVPPTPPAAAVPPATPLPNARPLPAEPAAASPEALAERSLLEGLRVRRAGLEEREQAVAAREMVLAAAERRLTQRIEELTAMQQRLEAAERARGEREEAGLRQLVKLYEGMRPRDAAAIFDELEISVLVQVVQRMREAKAAPVLGAMRPERARQLTAELARSRARPAGE